MFRVLGLVLVRYSIVWYGIVLHSACACRLGYGGLQVRGLGFGGLRVQGSRV